MRQWQFFNAPLSLDDHAFKTIMAALDMNIVRKKMQEEKIYNMYGISLEFWYRN
jgi:hypothetical protein